MACNACSKKRRHHPNEKDYDVMGGYKHLTARQIQVRLDKFKRLFCKACPKRYECDYPMYKICKNK